MFPKEAILIYLDNSATTLIKPKEVLRKLNLSVTKFSANPGRSGHKLSIAAAVEVEQTREKLAKMFNLEDTNNVIFTANCSSSLNLAILGSVKDGGHVICTENEHNSVLRPLEHLKEQGKIEYTVANQSKKGGMCREDIEKCIKKNTYMVICNHISNVNGDVCDIKEIGKLCKERDLLFLVDGAQSAGHEKIDMQENNISFLAIAPHKGFYSIQGLGALLVSKPECLSPILFGGTGTNSLELIQPETLPERFEVGTIATPAILALSGGIDFVNENFNQIHDHLDDLTTFLNYELSYLPIKIYTATENAKGVFAFNIPGMHSNEVANILNEKYGICVRGGYHCAAKKHEALGLLDQGAVRASISYFTTFSDIQKLIFAIKSMLKCKKMI